MSQLEPCKMRWILNRTLTPVVNFSDLLHMTIARNVASAKPEFMHLHNCMYLLQCALWTIHAKHINAQVRSLSSFACKTKVYLAINEQSIRCHIKLEPVIYLCRVSICYTVVNVLSRIVCMTASWFCSSAKLIADDETIWAERWRNFSHLNEYLCPCVYHFFNWT